MRKTEEKEVPRTKEVTMQLFCDHCGREIEENHVYFDVKTMHHLWGNDSIDSLEYRELCSLPCLQHDLTSYYSSPRESEEYEIEFLRFIKGR